jgi:imidazoleglycerol phosphate synthase glutamine amidotransferase subunit HisH
MSYIRKSQSSQSVTKGLQFHPFNAHLTTAGQLDELEPLQATGVGHHASAVSDLASSPLLEYLGYRFHKKYRIMICVSCQVALLATNALSHLANQHNIKATPAEKQQWDDIVI